ncbi:MAG: magnesium transporter, partial [Bdellovibrionales bacterium]|nr:magnesium transporter [Bdellovibrionales bacterium]
YYIYCVNERHQLAGIISLRQLATAPENKALADIVKEDVVTVFPEEPAEKAAEFVSHYDLIAIPVVSHDRELLGIVTVDDILDIIQEQATAGIYAQAGLQEDDRVFTPARQSINKRIPWMFLNLLLAALASSVVSLFENTMSHLIILASLKNIVAGMGGNTAIQSLTVVTRGLATGDFSFISQTKAIVKEVIVGVTIGIMTGISAGLLTYIWKANLMVSIVICISMIINSFLAAIAGAVVPISLKKMGWDPATGSGVLVTMFTDIISFFSFLGIATLGLKFFGV